jgi:hypothetical protein
MDIFPPNTGRTARALPHRRTGAATSRGGRWTSSRLTPAALPQGTAALPHRCRSEQRGEMDIFPPYTGRTARALPHRRTGAATSRGGRWTSSRLTPAALPQSTAALPHRCRSEQRGEMDIFPPYTGRTARALPHRRTGAATSRGGRWTSSRLTPAALPQSTAAPPHRCRSERRDEKTITPHMCRTAAQPYNMQVPSPSPERDGATTFIRPRTYNQRQGRGRQPRHRHKHWHGTSTGQVHAHAHAHYSIVALPRALPQCHTTTLPQSCTVALPQGQVRRADWQARTASLPRSCTAALHSAGTTSHRLPGPCGTDGVVGARGPRGTDGRWERVNLVTPMELVERLNLVTSMESLERLNLEAPMGLLERLNLELYLLTPLPSPEFFFPTLLRLLPSHDPHMTTVSPRGRRLGEGGDV